MICLQEDERISVGIRRVLFARLGLMGDRAVL